MRFKTVFRSSTFFHDLDRTLAILGLIFSLILTIYTVQEVGRIIYVVPAILIFCFCLIWLLIRGRVQTDFQNELSKSRVYFFLSLICFISLLIISVLTVYFRSNFYERPLLFFVIFSLMAVILTYEIFISGRKYIGIILLQIILMGVSIAWSQLLISPMLIGVDPWYHAAITNQIISDSALTKGYVYSLLPLFHLEIAIMSFISGLPYKFAVITSVSLGQIICNSLFIYIISEKLFKNYQIGLLAALFTTIANYSIQMSYWSIPNAFAGVFIPIVLYLIFFRINNTNGFIFKILAGIFLIVIILSHTITSMYMAILLFIIWGISKIYNLIYLNTKSIFTVWTPICFAIGMFSWWSYASGSILIFGETLKWGFSADFFDKSSQIYVGYLAVQPINEQIFNQLGLFLFFGISIIGFFYMISQKTDISAFTLAWVGIVPLVFSLVSLIAMNQGIQGRWGYFAQILLSIPLSASIFLLTSYREIIQSVIITKIKYLIFFVFMFFFVFFMIMNPIANIDNHIFSPNTADRTFLTQSEISTETLLQYYNGPVKADWYFSYVIKYLSPRTLVDSFDSEIGDQNYKNLKGNLVIIRKYILNNPFTFYRTLYKFEYNPISQLDRNRFSEVYNNGEVYGYL